MTTPPLRGAAFFIVRFVSAACPLPDRQRPFFVRKLLCKGGDAMYNQQPIPPFGGGFGFRPQPVQGYFPQQMQQAPQMAPQVAQASPGVTLVTDRQQAELAAITFDGTRYYYHNTSNDELYVKRFDDSTGRSPVAIYRRVPDVEERPAFVPLEAFEALMQRVANLEGAASDYQPRRAKEATE